MNKQVLTVPISTTTTDISGLQSDVTALETQNIGYTLSTNTLIQTALSSSTLVVPIDIAYAGGDVGDVITVNGAKTLHFTNCSNVGFSFTMDGTSATPTLIFDNCTLNSGFEDFIYLIDTNDCDKESVLIVKGCRTSAGVLIEDYKVNIIGGLS